MPKVKVEVLAEQLSYSYQNPDGTHTRADYVRGQVLEMEENDALVAAEGEPVLPTGIKTNSAGTPTFWGPERTPGTRRASVRIIADVAVPVSKPVDIAKVIPAPAPKVAEE
jgi:flagellar basal body rod protein FlgG